jgi:hypothetical protein
MSFLRIVLWALLFYLVIRTAKNVMKLFSGNNKSEPKKSTFKVYRSKYNIKKEDVIDAEYEEIKNSEPDNSKN